MISLCGSCQDFEQIKDDIFESHARPSEVPRMSVTLNSKQLPTYALNDVLVVHPCPATVSRFSFIKKEDQSCSSLVHCRSSGLKSVNSCYTPTAGGFAMPILSKDLQYIVREPVAPGAYNSLMHNTLKPEELMEIAWYCKEGLIYIDGSHLVHSVQHGDIIELSSKSPKLKVFLPSHLIS